MSKEKGLYKIPPICEKCGSEDVYVEAIIGNNDNIFVDYRCAECGYKSKLIPKVENLQRRSSTPLSKWRDKVFIRDNATCVICGKPAAEAHHIIPVRNCQEEKLNVNNGVALCLECHRKVHFGEYHHSVSMEVLKDGYGNGVTA